MIESNTIRFMGIRMHAWSMTETLDRVGHRIESKQFTQHVVVNTAKLVKARRDPALRAAIESCDVVNIDGMGVVWGARLCGLMVPERVTGIDLMAHLLDLAAVRGWRVYFLGAKPAIISGAIANVRQNWPELEIAGSHHGYFTDSQAADVAEMIRASNPDILLVAMSTPRKEQFVELWGKQTGAMFVMGVGGSLDIMAGITKRAPVRMQQLGLEWAYRLGQEPRRLMKRYIHANGLYIVYLVREIWKSRTTKYKGPPAHRK